MNMAVPVLEHRMALSFAARASGEIITDIITSVAASVTQTQATA
jgi:MoxR-like ATPase